MRTFQRLRLALDKIKSILTLERAAIGLRSFLLIPTFSAILVSPGLAESTSPPGWSLQELGSVKILQKRFPEGLLTLRIEDWQASERTDIKAIARSNRRHSFGDIPVEPQSWQRKAITSGEDAENGFSYAIVERSLSPNSGISLGSVLVFCSHDRVFRTVHAFGEKRVFRGKGFTQEAFAIVKTYCGHAPDLDTASHPPARSAQSPAPEFSRDAPPTGFAAIWYVGDFIPGVNGMRARQRAVMTFEDGSVTKDIDTVFARGPAASKDTNPKDWGLWRIDDAGSIEVKWSTSSSYKDFFVTRLTEPAPEGKRLSGCYSSRSGHTIGIGAGSTTSTMSVKKWCFAHDGRFSTTSSVAIGSAGSSGNASSETDGFYFINGHVIELVFDAGNRVTTSFAIMDEDDEAKSASLLIGASHFLER